MTYDFSIIRHLRKKMGLTIYGLSDKCGVSYVALSKLERNLGNPELKTLDKIARSLDIETHNLLALAEHERPRIVEAVRNLDHEFDFYTASIAGIHVSMVESPAGASGAGDHAHRDDYEITFVLSGKVILTVKNSAYEISAGQAVRFDCIFDHNYEVVEDTKMIHVLIAKQMGREPTQFPPIMSPSEKAARKRKK